MTRLTPLLALVALLAAACGGGSDPVTVPKGAVAQVGDTTITKAQLDATLASARAYYRSKQRTFPAPGSAAYRKLRDQSLDSLVQAAVFDQEAAKLGVGVTEDDVDRDVDDIVQQTFGGSESELRISLRQQGLTFPLFRAQERRQLVEDAISSQVAGGVKVSDAKARAYYRAHRADYLTSPSREVQYVLVKTRALAADIARQARAGTSFTSLVHRYTTDTASRATDGKATDTKGLFVAPFERVAFALKTSEVSQPVHTEYGWHVIKALAPVKPPRQKPYAEVASSIEAILQPAAQAAALQRFTKETYTAWCAGKIAFAKGYATAFCAKFRATR